MKKQAASNIALIILFLSAAPALLIAQDNATSTPPIDNATSTSPIDNATSTNPAIDGILPLFTPATSSEPIVITFNNPPEIITAPPAPTAATATSSEEISPAKKTGDEEDTATTTPEVETPTPLIQAQWSMLDNGLDDSSDPLAQINPSEKLNISRNFKICGIATNTPPQDVYSQIFYPENINFPAADAKKRQACGKAVGPACKMAKLTPAESFDLFCEKIQKYNSNLPLFAQNPKTGRLFNFFDLCAADGQILTQTAAVYCCDQELAYDDIAGDYQTAVISKTQDLFSNLLLSQFTYIPKAVFEISFAHIDYGVVRPNTETSAQEIVTADNETITNAVIRNLGNTPLNLSLWQDDMGMGQTNIFYKARLNGNTDTPWTNYAPFETKMLPQTLPLSQSAPLDFSVTVLNYPATDTANYQGQMKFDAAPAPSPTCP